MKNSLGVLLLIIGVVTTQTSIHWAAREEINQNRFPASEGKGVTCKYRARDIATVVGKGTSKTEAFKDAVTQCVDRRISLYEAQRGQTIDMDRGQLMIDSCVNLSCE